MGLKEELEAGNINLNNWESILVDYATVPDELYNLDKGKTIEFIKFLIKEAHITKEEHEKALKEAFEDGRFFDIYENARLDGQGGFTKQEHKRAEKLEAKYYNK